MDTDYYYQITKESLRLAYLAKSLQAAKHLVLSRFS